MAKGIYPRPYLERGGKGLHEESVAMCSADTLPLCVRVCVCVLVFSSSLHCCCLLFSTSMSAH